MGVLNLIIFLLKIRDAYIMCEFFQNTHTSKVRRKYKKLLIILVSGTW